MASPPPTRQAILRWDSRAGWRQDCWLLLSFAVFAVTIRADQIVVGVAINLLGMGLTSFLFRTYFVSTGRGVDIVRSFNIPFLSGIPYVGTALLQQNGLVYSTVPIVIAAWLFLFRTSYGLTVRAVGEYPEAVDVAGKSVALYRYSAVADWRGPGRSRR